MMKKIELIKDDGESEIENILIELLEAKFEKYNSVLKNFEPFFNAEELEIRFA